MMNYYKDHRHYVYQLVDPRTNEPRYVGCTVFPEQRLRSHLCKDDNLKKYEWVSELAANGLKPRMEILSVHQSATAARRAEMNVALRYRAAGYALFNCFFTYY